MELTANNLIYKTLRATVVDGLSFSIKLSQKTAIYGPEGSGKMVLILMLGGYLKPIYGIVNLDGLNIFHNLDKYRQKVGLGEINKINSLSEDLTPRENIEFLLELSGIKDRHAEAQKILDRLGIKIYADTPISQCNPLARAVTSLACAILNGKEIIILNEPTSRLTSIQAQRFWQIAQANLSDKTVIFSTKDINEAKDNADSIITINRGRLN